MLKQLCTITLAFCVSAAAADALAQKGKSSGGFDTSKLHFGAGLSMNEVSGSDTGTGWQIFGGYRFGEFAPKWQADVEVGYMETGDMEVEVCVPPFGCASASGEAKGLWASGVARYLAAPQVELLGRVGMDFGDDDGFMIGFGGGFIVNRNWKLRGEYVVRDNVDSLQFNVVYTP
ncbi:MAG TPA: outer membrane beta-barrel protein [Burkholderiales bacterium]|nr:outer membrane beta-barrel protein [Burkholderiales bacterium]